MPIFPLRMPTAHTDAPLVLLDRKLKAFKDEDGWKIDCPSQADADAAQALLDNHDPLRRDRERVRQRVAEEADRRIDRKLSNRKILALLSRGLELTDKRVGKLAAKQDPKLSDEEEADAEAVREVNRAQRRLRRAQKDIEAKVDTITTTAELDNFDPAEDPAWPAD